MAAYNPPHILIIDPYVPTLVEGLAARGIAHTYLPQCSAAEAAAALTKATVLVLRSKLSLNAAHLAQAPQLRLVIRTGAGTDHLDVAALQAAGVQLVTTPAGNRDAVGEHALGMLLGLSHRICAADAEVRQGLWRRTANMGTEVGGKTVGILGYGNTGGAFARKLAGLGCTVLAYDKYRTAYTDAYAQATDLDALLARAQVLSLHVPLTPETHHLANDALFARLQHPIYFLNLSRGPVTDTAALLRALHSGQVLGAGLDVLENEKLDALTPTQQKHFLALSQDPRVILTPHIGGWSHEAEQRFADLALAHIIDFK
jgi:D-3-phosphoglycerate dehydrogenase